MDVMSRHIHLRSDISDVLKVIAELIDVIFESKIVDGKTNEYGEKIKSYNSSQPISELLR